MKGPTDWFTGAVSIDPLYGSVAPVDRKAVEGMEHVSDEQYAAGPRD